MTLLPTHTRVQLERVRTTGSHNEQAYNTLQNHNDELASLVEQLRQENMDLQVSVQVHRARRLRQRSNRYHYLTHSHSHTG